MYIGYLPSYVRYHSGLSDKEKLLYCELTALADKNSFVELDRDHLCRALGIKDPASIRRYLNKLGKYELIKLMGDDHIAFSTDISSVIAYSPINEKPVDDISRDVTEKIVKIWNDHFGTRIRSTKQLIGQVKARMKSFSGEEIILGAKNRIDEVETNPWYSERENEHHKRNIDLLVRDDKKMEKCVNHIPRLYKKDVDFSKETVSPNNVRTISKRNLLK
jgi:hypothetical protein